MQNRRFSTGLGKNFGRLNGRKIPLAKVVDFATPGALPGPRTPDPDLDRFHITVQHGILNIPPLLYGLESMVYSPDNNLGAFIV